MLGLPNAQVPKMGRFSFPSGCCSSLSHYNVRD